MRIIRQGIIPETKPIQTTCSNCRTLFEFMPCEVKLICDQRDGSYYEMNCPFCNKSVTYAKYRSSYYDR